ncbi:PH domain-containing protein [Corallococcus macrosporus]|uniref:Membrane protein n=1 Tax=Corallococcus macrosporus DSM 14697 TaxID=1189310 RepID=A0A250JN15_9BACT|nr:PH domain-containing protein [Corallococcus macrosporus]ATB45053.1 membrane protein [Corallococcus macrosporus DSM 14697]
MTASGSPSPLTMVPGDGGFLSRLPTVLQPHRSLLAYYLVSALLAGPGFPILGLIRYFKYQTLRYSLDAEGITVRWGILFRREVSLTYARIQDIHLSSNVMERWLGLARIQIQTASGNSHAEITIEGIPEFAAMRDFLYSKMRGSRERAAPSHDAAHAAPGASDELAATLQEIASEVRALRLSLGGGDPREKQDV